MIFAQMGMLQAVRREGGFLFVIIGRIQPPFDIWRSIGSSIGASPG
jgi:hypothetical protein